MTKTSEPGAQLVASLASLLMSTDPSPAALALRAFLDALKAEAQAQTPVGLALKAALNAGANPSDPALQQLGLFERLQLTAALRTLAALLE